MNSTLSRRCLFLAFALCFILVSSIKAQDKLRPVSDTYVLKNVKVVTAPGSSIDNATLVIHKGLIKSVGKDVAVPLDAIQIDADSMIVYAGFIDGLSHAGIPRPKEDNNRRPNVPDPGNPPNELAGITPELQARMMIDPSDKSVEALRKAGFTMAHTVPYGRMLPGQGSIILLGGEDAEGLVYKEVVSMFSQLEGARGVYPSTVIGVMAKYREIYRQALLTRRNASLYAQNPSGMERPSTDRVVESFIPVTQGSLPVMFNASDIKSIQRVLELKNELGFQLMIAGVKQGWDMTDELKSANVPVFMSLDLPEWKEEKKDSTEEVSEEKENLEKRKEDMLLKYYTLPATWSAAGVRFGFNSMDAKEGDIHANLVKMKEKGVSEDVLLAGLTTGPAALLGLSRVAGTVEPGKMANLVITDKNYFEKDAQIRYVFVEGKLFEYEKKSESKKKNGEKGNDPSGTWTYSAETPNGTGTGEIVITKSGSGYSGQIKDNQSGYSFDLTDVEVDGSNVTFDFMYNDGSNELPLKVNLKMEGDSFNGMVDGGSIGTFPIKGQRVPKK